MRQLGRLWQADLPQDSEKRPRSHYSASGALFAWWPRRSRGVVNLSGNEAHYMYSHETQLPKGDLMQAHMHTVRQLAELLNVSTATIWHWTKQGDFPQPVKIAGSTRWPADEFAQWLSRIRESRADDG